jgi:hypothetical protein
MMGLVAAFSKAGAAIGTEVFTAIMTAFPNEQKANQAAFLIGSAFAVLGALIAWFIIPDVSTSLDEGDAEWKAYLDQNGWTAEWGDQATRDPSRVLLDRAVS